MVCWGKYLHNNRLDLELDKLYTKHYSWGSNVKGNKEVNQGWFRAQCSVAWQFDPGTIESHGDEFIDIMVQSIGVHDEAIG